MELKEMIKVMQHFADGGEVEINSKNGNYCWTKITSPSWDWVYNEYRIKEQKQKQKVTIEKWLCEYLGCKELKGSKRFFIIEKVVPFEVAGKKVKLIESYEVEL